jgi:hypothetical protein
VLPIVGDQVVERQAIVAGDEVDALFRAPFLVLIQIRAPDQTICDGPDHPGIPLEEGPHVVAKSTVPFFPAIADKAADLVETRCIPGFCNQLDVGQNRVRFDVPEDGGVLQRAAVRVAGQDRGEVEAETIHVHLADPVAETVEDQSPAYGFIGVQRVAAPAVVGVGRPVLPQEVVCVVRQSPEAQRRTGIVALRGMVVHDVQEDLDSGPVQRLDHIPEIVERPQRIVAGTVAVMGGEKRKGGVPPVIA